MAYSVGLKPDLWETVVEAWKSCSNPGKQTALAVGCIGVGALLAIGFRHFDGAGSNALAGFGLGLLLLVIGIAGLLAGGKQTIVVDARTRRITVEDEGYFRRQVRGIPFEDIEGVSIGYLGKRSNHVECYYLVLALRDGKTCPLFAPGRFYEGGSDRATVEGWRRRLEHAIADRVRSCGP